MQVGEYRLNDPQDIETPEFLVYEDMVGYNIDAVIRVCGSVDRIVPHAKTHKSAAVLERQMAAGMRSYKCATLREAELLVEHGVDELIFAYPLIQPKKIERLARLKKDNPGTAVKAIVSTPEHLEGLSAAMQREGMTIEVYVDLDTGMRRTGVQPGAEAADFYATAAGTPGISVLGVHVFDGHTLYKPDYDERKALVDTSIEYMRDVWERVTAEGIEVVDNVAGGSWSFHLYLGEENVRVSPGTWVYWDSRNATMAELPFKVAAVVLGQVVDRDPEMDTVTTDVGSKVASPDQPIPNRFTVVGHPKAELVAQSEEHGVVKLNGEKLDVGDYILAAPGHACTTTVKFPFANVVDANGNITGRYDHTARDH